MDFAMAVPSSFMAVMVEGLVEKDRRKPGWRKRNGRTGNEFGFFDMNKDEFALKLLTRAGTGTWGSVTRGVGRAGEGRVVV